MRDRSLKTILTFTFLYALIGACLLAGQPRIGAVQTADAGGNFEVPASDLGYFGMYRVASAE